VKTGDAVAGQVIGGVVSDGSLVINATNRSDNVDVSTGDATGTNSANVVTGLVSGDDTAFVRDAFGDPNATPLQLDAALANNQQGDNTANVRQSVNVQSGNGIGGQVIGAVVNGGTTDITASNTTTDSDVTTGEATGSNDANAFVGLLAVGTTDQTPWVIPVQPSVGNVQAGNNRLTESQVADAHTGDGIAGQVIGVVSAGNTRVDASNTTTDSSVETGPATSDNSSKAFVGLLALGAADEDPSVNAQAGDNTSHVTQSATALTGDGVAGQVAGIVTSAGGSVSAALANTSTRVDTTTGESTFDNSEDGFVGLLTADAGTTLGDFFSSG
jgi:hypothetical protein